MQFKQPFYMRKLSLILASFKTSGGHVIKTTVKAKTKTFFLHYGLRHLLGRLVLALESVKDFRKSHGLVL